MQEIIRSLDAAYAGYHFRSWTEGRYAVLWDMLGIQWNFEPGAVYHGTEGGYLPDFLLRLGGLGPVWAEVKPYLSIAGDEAPITAEVQRTIRIMTALCKQPSAVTESQAIPGVIFGGDPGPGSQAIVVWPMQRYPKVFEAVCGMCPFCESFCMLAEHPIGSRRYAVMCRCPRVVPNYRLSPIERRRATHHPAIIEAARVARSIRFDTPAIAAQEAKEQRRHKLTRADVKIARDRYANGESIGRIAKSFTVVESTIARAVRGVTWKDIS